MAEIYSSSPIYISGGETTVISGIGDNGPEWNGLYRIRFIDADGTVLKLEYAPIGREIIAPDATPDMDPEYLTFAGWNYDIDNLSVEGPMDIGATYRTVNDCIYLFINAKLHLLSDPTLGLRVDLKVSNTDRVDWGDGNVTFGTTIHTYNEEGEYIIQIDKSSSSNYISVNNRILGINNQNKWLKKAYLAYNTYLNPNYGTFDGARYLEMAVLPNVNATTFSVSTQYLFQQCSSLKFVVFPDIFKTIDSYAFYQSGIEHLSLPYGLTSVGQGFTYAYCLNELILYGNGNLTLSKNLEARGLHYFFLKGASLLPYRFLYNSDASNIILNEGLITMEEQCIASNPVKPKIVIPSTVTEINGRFAGTSNIGTLIVKSTSVPTKSGTSSLSKYSIDSIYVRDELVEDYKTNEGWLPVKDIIFPLSQYEGDY